MQRRHTSMLLNSYNTKIIAIVQNFNELYSPVSDATISAPARLAVLNNLVCGGAADVCVDPW